MDDVPRWVLRAVLGLAVVAARAGHAAQYSAHPEVQAEAVTGQQAAFIVRSAQRALAQMHRDTRDPAIVSIAGRALVVQQDARVAGWLAFIATTEAPVQWDTPASAIAQAHRWTRALREAGGSGAVAIPISPHWAQRAEAVCVSHAPAAWVQTQLLGGKTCPAFVADVLKVVYPHVDPMRPQHLEAFNPALAEDATLRAGLAALREVAALDPSVGPVAAVRKALPGWSSLQILRLLALASHNHALELRLLEHAVAHAANEADAVRAGQQVLADVGHLYALLAAFYGPELDKPYHFHGAALVACELIDRGYPRLVVAWTGALLGDAYERASGRPDADDVQLHDAGTRYGIAACQREAP